jgi:hypothetical protein
MNGETDHTRNVRRQAVLKNIDSIEGHRPPRGGPHSRAPEVLKRLSRTFRKIKRFRTPPQARRRISPLNASFAAMPPRLGSAGPFT